jgi:hypothetical protein
VNNNATEPRVLLFADVKTTESAPGLEPANVRQVLPASSANNVVMKELMVKTARTRVGVKTGLLAIRLMDHVPVLSVGKEILVKSPAMRITLVLVVDNNVTAQMEFVTDSTGLVIVIPGIKATGAISDVIDQSMDQVVSINVPAAKVATRLQVAVT